MPFEPLRALRALDISSVISIAVAPAAKFRPVYALSLTDPANLGHREARRHENGYANVVRSFVLAVMPCQLKWAVGLLKTPVT